MTRTGQCYCGAVQFELPGPIGVVINCHCRSCRRANGGPFSAVTPVPTSSMVFRAGLAYLKEFRSEAGSRFFCSECGGRLFNRGSETPELTSLLISTLDVEPADPPILHLNVESKAPWYEILDDRPQFAGLPPATSTL